MGNNYLKPNNLYSLLAYAFLSKGIKNAQGKAYHQAILNGGNPQFSPVKHKVMSYAEQNRRAKKRRKRKR